MRNSLISSRSSITLVLAIACVALAVMWPGWLTSFRAEGAYEPPQVAAAAGSAAVATASVQNYNISIRLGALRGEIPAPAGSGSGASADPVRQLDFGRLGLFLNGLGSFGDQEKTPRELGFDFHTGGFVLGGDYKLTNDLILGAAIGYLNTRAQLDDSAGHVTNNGYSLSAFGTYYIANTMYVDGIATYTWNAYDLERNVQGGANETARGHPDGNQFALSVGSGYDFFVGGLTAGPTFRVNYLNIFIDGYQERGAATSDLKVNSQTITSVTTDLGAQASYAISVPFGVLLPTVRFEWEHEYENNSRTIVSHSVVDPGQVLTVTTNGPDRDYFRLGAGVSATFKRGTSAFFYYEAVLGRNNFTNNSFTAGLRFEF